MRFVVHEGSGTVLSADEVEVFVLPKPSDGTDVMDAVEDVVNNWTPAAMERYKVTAYDLNEILDAHVSLLPENESGWWDVHLRIRVAPDEDHPGTWDWNAMLGDARCVYVRRIESTVEPGDE